MDISVKNDLLRCKIANSKEEISSYTMDGIGIDNVKKRLSFIYPDNHELKINDETNFFVVSMLIKLTNETQTDIRPVMIARPDQILTA